MFCVTAHVRLEACVSVVRGRFLLLVLCSVVLFPCVCLCCVLYVLISDLYARVYVCSGGAVPRRRRNMNSCNEAADIYSFAIVLWELASRKPPFENMNVLQVPATLRCAICSLYSLSVALFVSLSLRWRMLC